MPLHLLGKKSWNVYNSANIERVRKDEADARAREEAEEQRLQLEDAQDRIRLLRGEKLDAPTIENDAGTASDGPKSMRDDDVYRQRKRRRLYGEDDTDRDIRWAREDAEIGRKASANLAKRDSASDAPIQGRDGHIQLVPVPDARAVARVEKNAEAEVEKAQKYKQEEDQYTMRFSNAAGYKTGLAAPWYADKADDRREPTVLQAMPAKDVWGNEDHRRREREVKRVTSSDPLAFMQQAQRQLKQSEKDRDRFRAERAVELRELEREQRKLRRIDDVPALYLDSTDSAGRSRPHRGRHERHHRHRRRSRSPREDVRYRESRRER